MKILAVRYRQVVPCFHKLVKKFSLWSSGRPVLVGGCHGSRGNNRGKDKRKFHANFLAHPSLLDQNTKTVRRFRC